MNATPDRGACGRTIVNLKVHWRGPHTFLNVIENWVDTLRLIAHRISLRVCSPMRPTDPSVHTKGVGKEDARVDDLIPKHLLITSNDIQRGQTTKV